MDTTKRILNELKDSPQKTIEELATTLDLPTNIISENIDYLIRKGNITNSQLLKGYKQIERRIFVKHGGEEDVDAKSRQTISIGAAEVFGVGIEKITNIFPLTGGLTNRSFVFTTLGKQYVFRLPGLSSGELVNRINEKAVYDATQDIDFCEERFYFNEKTGVKIAFFYADARNADPENWEDVEISMELSRRLHQSKLRVDHIFSLSQQIDHHLKLCENKRAITYLNFEQVKTQMLELLTNLPNIQLGLVLCHVDFIHSNVLIREDGSGILIDWEYSGMADPMLDVAMWGLCAFYKKADLDRSVEIYLKRAATKDERLLIYYYVALCGFLWSLWSAYKQASGDEMEDYGLKMYSFAKDYYQHIQNLL